MEDVDREISEMKLSLNARARIVAESYLTAVSLTHLSCHFCCGAHLSMSKSSMHSSTVVNVFYEIERNPNPELHNRRLN